MAFKKGQVWNKQLWKYVPTMVVEPRQSFDPTENDEIKKNPIDDIINEIKTEKIEEVKITNIEPEIKEPEVVKEKLVDKNEIFVKAKRAETIIEYIEAFWFEYNRLLKQRLAEHFTMNIPNIYWLVWSKTFNDKLYFTLKKLDEKTVLDILLSFNIK